MLLARAQVDTCGPNAIRWKPWMPQIEFVIAIQHLSQIINKIIE